MVEHATAGVVGATTTLERATPGAALSLVRSHYAGLPAALQRVAETVLLDPPAVAGGTIVELAERSGTSVSTVTRFCRAIGLEGFAGLRLGLRDGGSAGGTNNGLRDGGSAGRTNNGPRDGVPAGATRGQRIQGGR